MTTYMFSNMTLEPALKAMPNVFDELPGKLTTQADWQTVFDYLTRSGSQGPGWTKEFQDGTNKAVYRPPAGPRPYMRFEWGVTNADNIGLRLYESMTDVDNGVNECPTVAQKSDRNSCIYTKDNSSSTDPYGWFILADDQGFVITNRFRDVRDWYTAVFAGAFDPYDATESFNACNSAGTDNYTRSGMTQPGSGSSYWHTFRDNKNLGVSRPVYVGYTPLGTHDGDFYISGHKYGVSYPDPATGQLLLSKIAISSEDENGVITTRGTVPGVYAHLHKSGDDLGLTQNLGPTLFQGQGDMVGKKLLAVIVSGGNTNDTLILSLDDWR